MLKRISILGVLVVTGVTLYSFFSGSSDKKVVQSLEALLPRLEAFGLSAYRNQDWCQVLVYNGLAFSSTNEETCVFVAKMETKPFSSDANIKLQEVTKILSDAKIKIRSVENVRFSDNKFDFVEFYEDCQCRTRYVYSPFYGKLPSDIPNELTHHQIDSNWYRVEEDWN